MKTRPGYKLFVVKKMVNVARIAISLNEAGYQALFVDDKEIGSPLRNHQYPDEITFIRLKLSAGREVIVASDSLPYWGIIGQRRNGFHRGYVEKYSDIGYWSYRSTASCDILSNKITFNQALQLNEGDIVQIEAEESAFYRQGDGTVTNNWITFPAIRPEGSAWKKYPKIKFTASIKQENWSLFLDCIIDKFFSEINNKTKSKVLLKQSIMHAKHRSRIERIVFGQCFDGASFDQYSIEVGIGERLLFKGVRNGKPIYAVDSPNYGVALYFFNIYRTAKQWATGKISAKEAEISATARIIHRDGWMVRAREI